MMTVEVLFFSTLRTVCGCDQLTCTMEGAPTVRDLLGELRKDYPALASWTGELLVAIDLRYAGLDDPLSDGQEVALMPPVQGG